MAADLDSLRIGNIWLVLPQNCTIKHTREAQRHLGGRVPISDKEGNANWSGIIPDMYTTLAEQKTLVAYNTATGNQKPLDFIRYGILGRVRTQYVPTMNSVELWYCHIWFFEDTHFLTPIKKWFVDSVQKRAEKIVQSNIEIIQKCLQNIVKTDSVDTQHDGVHLHIPPGVVSLEHRNATDIEDFWQQKLNKCLLALSKRFPKLVFYCTAVKELTVHLAEYQDNKKVGDLWFWFDDKTDWTPLGAKELLWKMGTWKDVQTCYTLALSPWNNTSWIGNGGHAVTEGMSALMVAAPSHTDGNPVGIQPNTSYVHNKAIWYSGEIQCI